MRGMNESEYKNNIQDKGIYKCHFFISSYHPDSPIRISIRIEMDTIDGLRKYFCTIFLLNKNIKKEKEANRKNDKVALTSDDFFLYIKGPCIYTMHEL